MGGEARNSGDGTRVKHGAPAPVLAVSSRRRPRRVGVQRHRLGTFDVCRCGCDRRCRPVATRRDGRGGHILQNRRSNAGVAVRGSLRNLDDRRRLVPRNSRPNSCPAVIDRWAQARHERRYGTVCARFLRTPVHGSALWPNDGAAVGGTIGRLPTSTLGPEARLQNRQSHRRVYRAARSGDMVASLRKTINGAAIRRHNVPPNGRSLGGRRGVRRAITDGYLGLLLPDLPAFVDAIVRACAAAGSSW